MAAPLEQGHLPDNAFARKILRLTGWAAAIMPAPMIEQWAAFKDQAEVLSGLDRDSLHIYAAVGLQLFSAFWVRKRLASLVPLFVVLTAAVVNEWADLKIYIDVDFYPKEVIEETIRDIWNSMLMPVILFLIARFAPSWLVSSSSENVDQEGESPKDESPPD